MRRAIAWLMVLAAIGIPTSFGAGVVAAGSSESAGGTTEPREIVQTDSAPRFESFTVSGLEQSYVADSQPTRHWCGPLGVGRFHWSISGGTEPLEITIAGQLVNPEDRSVDIPCRQIRQEYLSGPQPSASVVQVIAEVRDSDNQSGSAAIAIGFVSDAPTTQIDEIGVYAGVYDAFFSVRPWPTNHSPMDPLPRLALVRYRETGTTSWNYVIPLPAEPQNSCGPWCGRPHVSDLKQNQDYEHQAAWIWMELPLQWGERPPAGEGWWRSWASPEAMNWTEPRNFRTYGVENVVVEARDHSVTVSWRERGGKVHTWLTSPDWPGAIWTDPLNGHRWPYPTTDQEGEWSTAVFRGLPPDTNFNVTFKRTLPARFVQTAPQEYQVRTRPNASALTPGVFDPRSVTVAVVDDDLEVEWNDQSPQWWAGVKLFSGDSRIGRTRLGYRHSYSLLLPGGGVSYVQRQQMVIDHYESISGTVLYLNVWPTNRAQVADEYPFVCMAWKIELAPTNPDLILDRYFYSAWLKSGADIAPVESYWLSRDGNWPHSRCVLGHAVGP